MPIMNLVARHVIFIGHVQGVGFRYTAKGIADGLGLCGYVRNLPDGSVEMFVQGGPEAIDQCLERIGREFIGYIRDRKITPASPDPRCKDFRITY